MKKFIFTGLLFAFAVLFAGQQVRAQSVNVSGSIGTVKRGGSVKGTIVLSIPGGQHINSSRPNSQYAIPTSVKVSSGGGVKLGGVAYPGGRNRKFSFSEDTLNVYEGRAVVSFSVTVPKSFKGDVVKVRAVVRYQACTDEVCYPPKNQEVTLTAKVQ